MSVKRKAGGCYVTKRKVPRRAAPSTRLTPTQRVFTAPSRPRLSKGAFSAGTQTPGTATFAAGTQTPSTATFTTGTQTRRRRPLTLTPDTPAFSPVVRVTRVGSVGVQTEPVLGPNAAALVVQNTIATQTQPQPSPAVYPPDVQLGLAAIDMAAQVGLSHIERDAMGRTPMEAGAQQREWAEAWKQRFMGQSLGLQQSLQERRHHKERQFQVGTQTDLIAAPLVTALDLQLARANLRPTTQNVFVPPPATGVLGEIEAGGFNLRNVGFNLRNVGPPRIFDEVEESRQARFRERSQAARRLQQIFRSRASARDLREGLQEGLQVRQTVLSQLERSPTRNTRRVLERLAQSEGLTLGQLLRRDYLDMSGVPFHRLPLGGQFCKLLQRNKFAFSQKGNLLQCRQIRSNGGAARQRWYKVIDDTIVQLPQAAPSDALLRRLSAGE